MLRPNYIKLVKSASESVDLGEQRVPQDGSIVPPMLSQVACSSAAPALKLPNSFLKLQYFKEA